MAKTTDQVLTEVNALLANRKFTGNTANVRRRQKTEETIVLAVAIVLLDAGFSVGVNDTEEVTLHHSRDIGAIQKALFTTDEDYLLVWKNDSGPSCEPCDAWVRLVYGNDGWDVINDYLSNLDPQLGDDTAIAEIVARAEEGHI